MATITLDGQTVEVQDKATAQLIQNAVDAASGNMEKMQEQAKAAEDKAADLRKQLDEMKAQKDAQGEELEKAKEATTDAAISERLKTVSEARDQAAKIAGEGFTCDSLNVLEIKRQALASARPTLDWADKSEHYVQAAWDMQVEQAVKDPGKVSMDRLADDLKKRYTNDAGQMTGTTAYNSFLSGGKH